jgi:hypothetical protein
MLETAVQPIAHVEIRGGQPRDAYGFSMLNIENSDAQLPSAFHQGYYALGNLLYHPLKRVTIGSEFQFGRRVNFQDGFNVNDYRVQFSFKYDWNKGFEF